MHVKSFSQGLNVNLAQPGLEPGTFWSRSQVSTTRPQRNLMRELGHDNKLLTARSDLPELGISAPLLSSAQFPPLASSSSSSLISSSSRRAFSFFSAGTFPRRTRPSCNPQMAVWRLCWWTDRWHQNDKTGEREKKHYGLIFLRSVHLLFSRTCYISIFTVLLLVVSLHKRHFFGVFLE